MNQNRRQQSQRGTMLIAFGIAAVVLAGLSALAVDVVVAYVVKANLTDSVDAALLSAARVSATERDQVASNVFQANFPQDSMMASSMSHSPVQFDGATNTLTMTATATSPTYFMRVFGHPELPVNAVATVGLPSAAPPPELLVVDEDAIDTGVSSLQTHCGTDITKCINDDLADLNVRTLLFTRPAGSTYAPASDIILPTGQIGDEGLFKFGSSAPCSWDVSLDCQVSNQNGAEFTLEQYILTEGNASNESNLDKVRDVFPLRTDEIEDLVGKTVCAVVYGSDISVDFYQHHASLKGATTGLTAFHVTALAGSGGSSSSLPNIQVNLLDPVDVASTCSAAAAGHGSGPGPVAMTPFLVR